MMDGLVSILLQLHRGPNFMSTFRGAFSVIVKTDCETDGSFAALLQGEKIYVSLHKTPGEKILKSTKRIHMLPPYTAKILGPMLEKIVASRSGGQLRKDTSILLRDDTIIFSE